MANGMAVSAVQLSLIHWSYFKAAYTDQVMSMLSIGAQTLLCIQICLVTIGSHDALTGNRCCADCTLD